MGESGVHGGKVPCQSQRRTVPKEPSPNVLIGVYERGEPVRVKKGNGCRERGVHGEGRHALEEASPTTSLPLCMDTAGMPTTGMDSVGCEGGFGGWWPLGTALALF